MKTERKNLRAEKTILTFTYKGNTICMLPDLAETMEPKKTVGCVIKILMVKPVTPHFYIQQNYPFGIKVKKDIFKEKKTEIIH